jgi:hypothetical protein
LLAFIRITPHRLTYFFLVFLPYILSRPQDALEVLGFIEFQCLHAPKNETQSDITISAISYQKWSCSASYLCDGTVCTHEAGIWERLYYWKSNPFSSGIGSCRIRNALEITWPECWDLVHNKLLSKHVHDGCPSSTLPW